MPTPAEIEKFLVGQSLPHISVTLSAHGSFIAATYWPNGEPVKDTFCCGIGGTLEEAISEMREKVEKAKNQPKRIASAAECKAAVLDLIEEHSGQIPDASELKEAIKGLPVA